MGPGYHMRRAKGLFLRAPFLAFLFLVSSCTKPSALSPPEPTRVETPTEAPFFLDVTAPSGIDHTYRNGEEAEHVAILEGVGGGAGLLDFDGDGLLDVLLIGGGYYDGPDKKQIKGFPCKLYKNLGNFHFKDVTHETGLDKILFYTHGCAVADYDNDGWPDVLLTGWGRLALLHNEPDGKGGRHFVDVTQKAGLTSTSWSTSAGWADFDGDGHVDLYVVNYLDWSFNNNPFCSYDGGITRDIASPRYFKALPHILYRNNGDGTFTDVSRPAGLRGPRQPEDYPPLKKAYREEALARFLKEGKPPAWASQEAERIAEEACRRLREADVPEDPDYGKGLGIAIVDVNFDGKPDVYVTNDTTDKFLYINRSRPGQILFQEMGLTAGVARDEHGSPSGSMGTDAGDPLGNGRPALWVCNYETELHSLYLNECRGGQILFRFGTHSMGLSAIPQVYVSWGTQFVDFDLDGWEDLFVSSGHFVRFSGGKTGGPRAAMAPRAMLPMLLLNREWPEGRRSFQWMNQLGGTYFQKPHRGRGAAFGDLDNDGRVDLVLNNLNKPTVVLRNVAGTGHHWLGIELKRPGHRDAVGARVILEAGGRKQTRFAKGGTSFASACDKRLVFGLGECDKVDRLTVVWPTREEQTWPGLDCDQYWTLTEGERKGRPSYPSRSRGR